MSYSSFPFSSFSPFPTVARLLRWHGSPLLQPSDRTRTEILSEPFLERNIWDRTIIKNNFCFFPFFLTCSLISDVLQCGGDVNLLGSLHHPVKDHIDEDIGPRPSNTVAAVDDHRAWSSPITFIDFPEEGRMNERAFWLCSQRENLFSCFLLTQPMVLLMLNLLIKSFNPLLDRGGWWVARSWECSGRFDSLVLLQGLQEGWWEGRV